MGKIPDKFTVTAFDAMVLYYNTMRAAQLGWTDADRSMQQFISKAKEKAIEIPREELEAMLAACVYNSEAKEGGNYFWHPMRKLLKGFIQELMRHRSTERFYYDTYYNYFTKMKRANTAETGGALIPSNKEDQ